MILPVLSADAYASRDIAARAVAIAHNTEYAPFDCIIVSRPGPTERAYAHFANQRNGTTTPPPAPTYTAQVHGCRTQFATLEAAVAHARQVLQPTSAECAIDDYLRAFSGAAKVVA